MSQQKQALSLLKGILEETQSEAEAEKTRLEAEMKRRDEEERSAAESAEARRREEAERRLAEEDARQRAAAERRAAELERIRIEDLKARGLWQEPVVAAAPEPAPMTAPVARPQMSTVDAMAVQRAAAAKARRVPMLIAAVAILGIGGGAGGWWYAQQIEYVDSATSFSKVEVDTVAVAMAAGNVGFNRIPDPVVIPVEQPTQAATSSGRSGRSGRGSTSAPATEERPRINLGGAIGRER